MTFSFLTIRLFLLMLGVFYCFLLSAQTISGTVKNAKTGDPMPFANVFINNTTKGSTTDEEGHYSISGELPRNLELVASFVGFVTATRTLNLKGSMKVNFELEPLESLLTEVQLKSKRDKKWERDLRRFKQVFLALPDDPFASQLDIKNPWVLDFETVKESGPNYVQATAQEPLQIVNDALGYELTYYLEDYRYYHHRSTYVGYVYFSPQDLTDTVKVSEVESNKIGSYMGSVRHLLKSVLLAKVYEEDFQIFEVLPKDPFRHRTNVFSEEVDKSIKRVYADSIRRIPLKNGNYRVVWPFDAEIHFCGKYWINDYYSDINCAISWISAPLGYFDIDKSGVPVDPTQVVLSGYMGRQRMGRFLPYDYVPREGLDRYRYPEEVNLSQLEFARLNNLREKPYFSTNKAYYYPGETVWLGGQMLYQNSIMSDTLSRVLYVDLMNQDSELIQSEVLPVREGKVSGAFVLPKELTSGDYFLRAYTEWMRNFPDEEFFTRAFPVLGKDETIQSVPIDNPDLYGDLTITLSDSAFIQDSAKEMVFNLSFYDETEELIDAQFTVSLTDADLVSTVADQMTIIKAAEWQEVENVPKNLMLSDHQIEFGITVEGQFTRDRKRDPMINPITIVRDDLADYGMVETDSSGYFRATGLNYTDTATISIAALDTKKRSYGSVSLLEKTKPDFKGSYPKLTYDTYLRNSDNLKFDVSGDYVLLEEFVKEDEKIETLEDRNYGYGNPDRELSEEQLATISPEALAGYFGFKRGGKSIGNYNFGLNASNPLLIIDGAQYPFLDDEEFDQLIGSFIPAELESIKVYTFNASSFGMAGFGGVIMITTKKGKRLDPTEQTAFNSEGFQQFRIRGFSPEIPFPDSYESDQAVERRPTLYWKANTESDKGVYTFKVKIPPALQRMNLKVEGLTKDGLPFKKTFGIDVK